MKESRISPRTVYVSVVLLLALLVGLYALYQIGQVLLAFGSALLLAVVLGGPVDYLAGCGVPRPWTPWRWSGRSSGRPARGRRRGSSHRG